MGRKPKGYPKKKIAIRLDLKGALKEKFEYLKEYYGIEINKQLTEYLIIQKYEELKKRKNPIPLKTTSKLSDPLLVTLELHLKETFLAHTIIKIANGQTLPPHHLDPKLLEQRIRHYIITKAERKGQQITSEHIDELTKNILEYHKEIVEGLALLNIKV